MNIATKSGMNEAIRWQERTVGLIRDGGVWLVPRSWTVITIHHCNKCAVFNGPHEEPDIRKVFRAMGWTVMDMPQTN